MKTLLTLLETREGKVMKMAELLQTAKDEAKEGEELRSFTDPEQSKFDTLEREIDDLDKKIIEAKRIEEAQKTILKMEAGSKKPVNGSRAKDTKEELYRKFSISRAVRIAAGMEAKDGAEKEVEDIAREEAKSIKGVEISGFGIPSDLFVGNRGERTHYTAGTAATAGNLIQNEYSALNESLIPKLMIEKLGGKVTTGHNGTITRVKQGGYLSALWKAEETAVAESNNTFVKTSYNPNKLGALTYVTKEMLIMDSYGLEGIIKSDLQKAIKIALDAAAINGTGADEQPSGILANSGISTVALGTNGAVPTWANIVALETAIETALADLDNLKYLTTPGIKGILKNAKKDAGSGLFVWDEDMMNGYKSFASTQVPSELTKGTSEDNAHAIIFGDFSQVEMAQFGGLDLVVNPYSYAKEGYVQIVANSWWNVIIDYPESFAAIVDALLA